MSYRDVLARKGYQPIHIERTQKRGGDVVLHSWARPAETAPGKRVQFAGIMRKAVGA